MRITKEKLTSALEKASGYVREYTSSLEVIDVITKIGEKNKLHIDTLGNLTEEISYVLLGVENSFDFEKNLVSFAHISAQQSHQVATDVNEQIFKPVQDSLRAMQETAEHGQIEEKHLSREELLHQLENPTPIPMSGRRQELPNEPKFMVSKSGMISDTQADSLGGSTSKSDEEVEPPVQPEESEESEEGTPIPINKFTRPQSILEKKLAAATVADKNQTPIDPYRESTL